MCASVRSSEGLFGGWHVRLTVLVVLAVMIGASPALAKTIYAYPGDNLTAKINEMEPGDTLILTPGDYYSTVRITDKNGDADHWFVMRGSHEGVARIRATGYNNMFEVRRSSYWRIENLELDGRNIGSEAFKTQVVSDYHNDYAHHIVLDGLEIHHFRDNGISTKCTVWDMTIRNCYIHDIGDVGLYLGNSDGYLPIINLVFENNFVERTGNYNMQIKAQNPRVGVARGTTPGLEFDSWGWIIRDNVWMRDPATADAARPNLLVDAAPMSGVGSDDLAIIEGNVVLGQVSNAYADNGFQLSGNLRVVNNIVMNVEGSGCAGIRIGQHQGIYPRHLEVLNNTVLIIGGTSSTRCLSVWDVMEGPYTQVIANNALIRGNLSHPAVSLSIPASVIVANNIIRGTGARSGFTPITVPLSEIFVNPVYTPGEVDLYPVQGSPLIGAGANLYAPLDDFNGVGRPRDGLAEVGAYEVYGEDNPGWQIDRDFKHRWIYGDCDGSGAVDLLDVFVVANAFGSTPGDPNWDTRADVNGDGAVDLMDLLGVVDNFGKSS